jgi:hypothetical protein
LDIKELIFKETSCTLHGSSCDGNLIFIRRFTLAVCAGEKLKSTKTHLELKVWSFANLSPSKWLVDGWNTKKKKKYKINPILYWICITWYIIYSFIKVGRGPIIRINTVLMNCFIIIHKILFHFIMVSACITISSILSLAV